MKRHKTVDEFIESQEDWREHLLKLREIMLSTDLEETVKWGGPVYTYGGKNIAGLGAFKSYVGIWFFQGALLEDKKRKLMNAQEGTTKAMRQWRFSTLGEIDEKLVKAYLEEAIQNQQEGREIKPAKRKPLIIPMELKKAFGTNPALEQSFNAFNLTRKREFAEYISEARREETKMKRLEKIIPMILENRGLNDKYRK